MAVAEDASNQGNRASCLLASGQLSIGDGNEVNRASRPERRCFQRAHSESRKAGVQAMVRRYSRGEVPVQRRKAR